MLKNLVHGFDLLPTPVSDSLARLVAAPPLVPSGTALLRPASMASSGEGLGGVDGGEGEAAAAARETLG